MRTGLDVFVDQRGGAWRNKRLGLLVHQASVTARAIPAPAALRRTAGLNITVLFAPEHGLAGTLQDQIKVPAGRDKGTGLPVHSLYGDPRVPAQRRKLSPTAKSLKSVDALVFDLQDIGVRYYTFVWTMALALERCARAGKSFIVLDRPNPLGGLRLEGNIPDPAYASFVGLTPLPVRHGMTTGELAVYLNAKHRWNADLHVVPMRGWKRRFWFDDTSCPWVPPSPNMPTLATAAVYAGMCLVEGTNLSEGRGTTRPFETVGAPFVDGTALAEELNRKKLPGVVFRPAAFRPSFHKWSGRQCGGVQIHLTDRHQYPSFLAGLVLIQTVRRLWPKQFSWRKPPYEFENKKLPFDILCGTDALRKTIENDRDVERLEAGWNEGLRAFKTERARHLLYT